MIEEVNEFVPLNFLPPFLRSTKEFTILDCKDGYVVFGYPNEGDITVKSSVRGFLLFSGKDPNH